MKRLFAIAALLASSTAFAQTVLIETSMGDMKAKLIPEKSPKTVENFLSYVDSGFYNGVIFHRVIPNFMIQTGGMTPDMNEKPTNTPIVNESNNYVRNERATLSMARTSNPNSAAAQFFINLKHNRSLDYMFGRPGYAVFGYLTEGLDVMDKIATVETATAGMHGDVPIKPILIKTIRRIEDTPADSEETVKE